MRLVVGSAALATAAGFAQAQSVAVNSPTETVLYSFKGGIDGAGPRAGLIFDANGALYGTTCEGGTAGYGTVFKLTPPTAGKTQWTETVLHRFPGGSDGARPSAGLICDSNGALYGTTEEGGISGHQGQCSS